MSGSNRRGRERRQDAPTSDYPPSEPVAEPVAGRLPGGRAGTRWPDGAGPGTTRQSATSTDAWHGAGEGRDMPDRWATAATAGSTDAGRTATRRGDVWQAGQSSELGSTTEAAPGPGRSTGEDGRGRGDDRTGSDRTGRSRRRDRPAQRPASSMRLAPRPEGTRRFLVLGEGNLSEDIAALDVDTRVVVRLHGGLPPLPDGTIQPFDVVDAVVSVHDVVDDPSRPEARLVAGPMHRAGVIRGRVRRLLRSTVAPEEPHLLGFPGSQWPYWELHGSRPSVAVITPSRGPMLFKRTEDGTAWVRFGWYRTDNWLPLLDRRAAAVLAESGRRKLAGKALASTLEFRPTYLVVAVGFPRGGYCTKSVLAVLPRS